MNRETIYSTLFALLNKDAMLVANGGQFNFITRRPQLWNEYNSDQYPVLGMIEDDENVAYPQRKATAGITQLKAEFYIYTDVAKDPTIVPSIQLNNCVQAVADQLMAGVTPGQVQTLGGIVDSCWIEGRIQKAPGYTGVNGIAIIPVSIVVPC